MLKYLFAAVIGIGALVAAWCGGYASARADFARTTATADAQASHALLIAVERQMAAQRQATVDLHAAWSRDDQSFAAAEKALAHVQVAPDCTVGPDAIAALNDVRSAR